MATWQSGWRSRLVLLASALLVPLLVAGAFVWAGWQSSDRLHHNQGVVVNLDEPVTDNGQTRQLGNQLGAQLVGLSGEQFDWDFGVPADQAQAGLASGRYSVAVVIPKNFTSALLSNGKQRTVLAIQTSPLASIDQKVMANTLAEAAQRGLAKQLGANALSSIYVAFDQVDKDLVTASTKSSSTASAATSLASLASSAKTQAGTVAAQTKNVASGSQSVAAAAGQAQKSASDANKSGSAGASTAAQAGQAANQHQTQAGSAASGASGLGTSVGAASQGARGAANAASGIGSTSTQLATANTATGTSVAAAVTSSQKYRQAVSDAAGEQKGLSTQLNAISTATTTYTGDVAAFVKALRSATTPVPPKPTTPTVDPAALAQQLEAHAATIDGATATVGTASAYATALQSDFTQLYGWASATGFNTCDLTHANRDGLRAIIAAVTMAYTDPSAIERTFGDYEPYKRIVDPTKAQGGPFTPQQRLACMLFIDGMSDARLDVKAQLDGGTAAKVDGGQRALADLPAAVQRVAAIPGSLRELATQLRTLSTSTPSPGTQNVLDDPTVKAQLDLLGPAGTALSSAIKQAQTADANNQKAIAALTSLTGKDADSATVKNLAAAVAANTAEATRIAALATQLSALQDGMKALTTALSTARQQADGVAKQTASTSTGAAALATQIQALQKQLATASGAGAGTAAQTAKVASGASQLSKSASDAAKSAGGLSSTVTKVSNQSTTVSQKATDAANSVKGTSTTVKNQKSQQTTATSGQALTPGTTATTDQARHPNIAWWTPLAAMAMWLGAMAMYMLFRPISSAIRSSDATPGALVGQALAPGLVVGALQGVIMGAASIGVMRLGVGDGAKALGVMLLMAMAFMAVNFVLVALLGIFGRILSILLAVVTGLGVATNALPETFDRIRNLSPLTPAVNALRAVAAGAPGAGAETFHLVLWTLGALALATLLVLRSRLAAAPHVATAFATE